jgi:hypothetical protein
MTKTWQERRPRVTDRSEDWPAAYEEPRLEVRPAPDQRNKTTRFRNCPTFFAELDTVFAGLLEFDLQGDWSSMRNRRGMKRNLARGIQRPLRYWNQAMSVPFFPLPK